MVCALLITIPCVSRADHWRIDTDHQGTEMVFHSKATMESFDGHTRRVQGWIEWNAADLADSTSWQVEVDLTRLETGIGIRDQHMRDNHLHTDKYPTAVFRGSSLQDISAPALVEGAELQMVLVGQLTLHGISRERRIPVTVRMLSSDAMQVEATFRVSLADHDIPRPRFLLLKLADSQEVEVRLHFTRLRGENP
jgi:polyisoprenoid-binding protein YceI